nr:DUF1707 domain-containing protein [Auraticoccus cholistanensis]
MPISSRYRSRPDEPLAEQERAELNERLNAAFADGALVEEEYRQRMDLLFAARTLGDLVPVVQGLPASPTHAVPAIVAQDGRPGELSEPRRPRGLAPLAVGGGVLLALLVVLLLVLLLG